MSSPPIPGVGLQAVLATLEAALRDSVADETELVWVARRRDGAATGPARQHEEATADLSVRVAERGRMGSHRCGSLDPGEIEFAIRQALAHARVQPVVSGWTHLPPDQGAPADGSRADLRLQELTPDDARDWLATELGEDAGQLEWVEAEVAVLNSRGLRRWAELTSAQLTVRSGTGPAGGLARAAARRLADLPVAALREAAAGRRAGSGEVAAWEPTADTLPVVLAPEATRALLLALHAQAFTAASYAGGASLLRDHLGTQVFDRRFQLVDDATDDRSLGLLFDLEGADKRRVELIGDGTPRTPALDQRQAAALGLAATGHAVGGNDARAQHLILMPGENEEADLLQAAEGGLWIGDITTVECSEPRRVALRALLRGVRRIRDGERAEAVEDLIWQGSLVRAAANLLGVGNRSWTAWGEDGGVFGSCSCPALALASIQGLRALRAAA